MTTALLSRAEKLKLNGLITHWEEIKEAHWLENLIEWEESERSHRSLERRLYSAHIGKFKSLSDFDWTWPKKIDREIIEELMRLDFLKGTTNVLFCGPNGVGKSMIARNIAHEALLKGHTVLFITAAKMLSDLISQDGDNALRRRIQYYSKISLLIVDEVGYLSYSNRHADLLFAVISGRYEMKSTIITTNKPFTEWNEIFPNAACVVTLIDRLVHNSELLNIEGDSYRLREAKEKATLKKEARTKKKQ